MFKKSTILFSVLVLLSLILAACAPAATPTAAPEETVPVAPEATEPPVVAGGKVGVVLPTKEEPRWLQDEARL